MTIGEKLRDARIKLGFSQDYVANCLGMARTVITQIELGNRKVSTDEATMFCNLYHLSGDYVLDTTNVKSNQMVFARGFNELTDKDQREILNLINYKRKIEKEKR